MDNARTLHDANGRSILMTVEEKRAMKAACVQAAATLIAARDSSKGQIDVEECITLAALLYVRVVKADWGEPTQHALPAKARHYDQTPLGFAVV
jgi:hypothetical protein